MALNFRFLEIDMAVQSMVNQDYSGAKQHFFTAALIDKLRVEEFNDNLFDFGLPYVVYPILSDNDHLIESYSRLKYRQSGKLAGMEENVLNGEDAIWCNTVQLLMGNDILGVKRNLSIIEKVTLQKLAKNQQELIIDYEFYKALLAKDKSQCEKLIEQLLSPQVHKKRNINNVLSPYVSQPALGYAKLAWRLGVEVEINSPLVPKALLPIEPLDHYEIPYDFLK
jgi:hypothetical protein